MICFDWRKPGGEPLGAGTLSSPLQEIQTMRQILFACAALAGLGLTLTTEAQACWGSGWGSGCSSGCGGYSGCGSNYGGCGYRSSSCCGSSIFSGYNNCGYNNCYAQNSCNTCGTTGGYYQNGNYYGTPGPQPAPAGGTMPPAPNAAPTPAPAPAPVSATSASTRGYRPSILTALFRR